MPPRTSRGLWLVVAAISSAAVGCSSDARPTAPSSSSSAAAQVVAATFTRMGDSVVAAHGDTSAAIRYYGAAAVLRRIGVFDTITVMIDSVPQPFDAVALAVSDSGNASACPTPPMDEDGDNDFVCPWGVPRLTRTLFAWQPGNPPHIVELVATTDSGAVGIPGPRPWRDGAGDSASTADSARAMLAFPARLKYFAGDGTGIWWGSAGTQMNTVAPNGAPCPTDSTAADSASTDRGAGFDNRGGHGWGTLHIADASCQMASFQFALNGTVSVPPVMWWARNVATGTHTVAVASSSVPGAYVTLTLAKMGR